MQPGTDQWGQPTQPAPQQQIVGQPVTLVGQPTVGVGVPMGMGYPATQATAALILSILGLVGCSLCTAIPGLILANGALAITEQHPNHPDAGTAKAAMIIAWIVIGLTVISILFYVGLFAILGVGAIASEGY